ncbi:MAG: AN1-type zinc finger domain-containing protein [Candidatus Heimdallarchaeota archaeon]
MTYLLTPQERGTLVLFGIFGGGGIAAVLLLPLDLSTKLFVLGIITIISSCLIGYSYIIFPAKTDSPRSSQYLRYRSLEEASSFQANVIPPSKMSKKTIMGGMCTFCGTSALMGFTCSYCNDYFCAEHRLPEKHGCRGLR